MRVWHLFITNFFRRRCASAYPYSSAMKCRKICSTSRRGLLWAFSLLSGSLEKAMRVGVVCSRSSPASLQLRDCSSLSSASS